jgi:hypothetical protein
LETRHRDQQATVRSIRFGKPLSPSLAFCSGLVNRGGCPVLRASYSLIARTGDKCEAKGKGKTSASPDLCTVLAPETPQTARAAFQASSDGLAASTPLVVTQQAACHRHCVSEPLDSPTLLHLPFNAASPICVLRSCMGKSRPQNDGLRGWASIRKGMCRRPQSLLSCYISHTHANCWSFYRISPILYARTKRT